MRLSHLGDWATIQELAAALGTNTTRVRHLVEESRARLAPTGGSTSRRVSVRDVEKALPRLSGLW